ncbi:MAG: hypothetical protein ACRD47_13780 [Nitrososphaeraceae archaeon]
MSTIGLTLLLSILALTGGVSFDNLFNIGKALAIESNCDPKIQSLLGCPSRSDKERSFAIASAKTLDGEKKSVDIDIEGVDSTSGVSLVIAEDIDPKSNSDDSNIESLIPSTINAIPFP